MSDINEERKHVNNLVEMTDTEYVEEANKQSHADLVVEASQLRHALKVERDVSSKMIDETAQERQRAENAEAALRQANAEMGCHKAELTRDRLNSVAVANRA